jgi:hypothetical protein
MLSLLTRLPAVHRQIRPALAGIATNYRMSPIVEEHADGLAKIRAGDRVPDAPVTRTGAGSALQLYDVLADHRPVVLDVGDISEPWPSDFSVRDMPRYHVSANSDGDIVANFGSAPAAYLIRPDGYVGLHCRRADVATELPRYLARYFPKAA